MAIPKTERNGQITPADLQTPEDGLPPLRDRSGEELAAIKKRIEAARALEAPPVGISCAPCFRKGRDAAIRAILGEG